MSDSSGSDIVASSRIGLINHATLGVANGKIVWAGPSELFESNCYMSEQCKIVSAEGAVVTPGFVDSHTHPLFGATRADEFAMRAAGAD